VRIVIHDVANRVDAQTRAYAERRVFATVVQPRMAAAVHDKTIESTASGP
jgi:hypothetical protein